MNTPGDEVLMQHAMREAQAAFDEGEVPVGAVIVHEGKVIGRGRNAVERTKDPTAHAEILAIGAACGARDDWRLDECTLYATLEPCPMCAGAIINARVARVVFGARDIRLGACGSTCSLLDKGLLNRSIEVVEGVLKEESAGLLQAFFRELRKKKDHDADK